MSATGHRFFAGASFFLAVAVCAIGIKMLISAVSAYQARLFLDSWETSGKLPSDRSWTVAMEAVNRAVAYYPVGSGRLLDMAGRVLEWKYLKSNPGYTPAEKSRRQAAGAFRESIRYRPGSPYTWAALAYTKLRLVEIDAEFGEALRNAQAFGPWRPEINKSIAEIGVISWVDLNESLRDLVLTSIRRSLNGHSDQAQHVIELIDYFGLRDTVCRSLPAGGMPSEMEC